MAQSINRIMILGRLGKDAETRFTANNLAVTTFSVATDHSYKDKDGNWQTETTWHNVVAFSLSDYYKDNLKKGKRVYVEGRLTKRDYTDKDGVKRYSTDTLSERIIPIDADKNSSESTGGGQDENYAGGSAAASGNTGPSVAADENDDLPF
jgi:single-strand DNA-binding protein